MPMNLWIRFELASKETKSNFKYDLYEAYNVDN